MVASVISLAEEIIWWQFHFTCRYMGCDVCGDESELAFTCSFCAGSFCAEHQLPENHDCPQHNPRTDKRFESAHPSRLSSSRTDTPTSKDHETVDPGRGAASKEPEFESSPDVTASGDVDETDILYCKGCHTRTDHLKSCSECQQKYCEDCVAPPEHQCLTATGNGSEGLLSFFVGILRWIK